MCVFVRVPGRTSDFFWLFFFRSVLWRPAAIIWCVNPFVLRHFFAFWIFCFFCSVFVFALGLPGRGRVRILFFAVFVLPFFCMQNPVVLSHFFCVSAFLLFLFRFCVCFGPARPSTSSNFVFAVFVLSLLYFLGYTNPFVLRHFFAFRIFCFFSSVFVFAFSPVLCCWLLLVVVGSKSGCKTPQVPGAKVRQRI